jgi:hypothetical protein
MAVGESAKRTHIVVPSVRSLAGRRRRRAAPPRHHELRQSTALGRADSRRLNDQKAIEGMGLNLREVMDLAISTISAMTFSWGFVHCDPHPGNILVRKHPTKRGRPQIVSGERTERPESSVQRLASGVSPTYAWLQSDPIRYGESADRGGWADLG